MGSKRTIRPEERAIWRKVAKSVRPLDEGRAEKLDDPLTETSESGAAPKQKMPAKPKRPAPKRRPSAGHKITHPVAHHPQIPHDRSTEKRVRRGRVDLDARLDLHGLTQDQALSSLTHFLRMAWQEGYKSVLVITGKGMSQSERQNEPWEYPESPGVLRRKLPEWLGSPALRQYVSGFANAHVRHGGSGAFYVTLKTR